MINNYVNLCNPTNWQLGVGGLLHEATDYRTDNGRPPDFELQNKWPATPTSTE